MTSRLDSAADPPTIHLSGEWRLSGLRQLAASLSIPGAAGRGLRIDGAGLVSIDTAAALLLLRRLRDTGVSVDDVQFTGFSPSHRRIIDGVAGRLTATDAVPPALRMGMLAQLGAATRATFETLSLHTECLGRTVAAIGRTLAAPQRLRWRETITQMQQAGVSAIPVVGLVMFLIGAVMAYLLGLQAGQYGANIYVVDGVTLGTVREFAPLLVATVVAGRSGAAFTAQLGTMKLTEETDAIRTLGLSVEQVLLLPRVLALVVVLPLLVFLGSVAALAGAALICSLMLDITPPTFIERMHGSIALRHYLIGLVKAPVFAAVIAIIGCSMGFGVQRDTRAIGLNTTSTVVQCIVAVVLLDAVFAVIFQELGW